jgi:rare lipoprotein A
MSIIGRVLLFAFLSVALGSCAIFGARTSKAVFQSGPASWYGETFQGRRTASGEIFDSRQLTAAHRTLPFGQKVEVRSLSTGRSVVVRINDRGPFHSKRILDMSKAAAEALGILAKGEDEIEMHLISAK